MGFREAICEGCGVTFRYVPNGRPVRFHDHACYAASLCHKPEDAWAFVDRSGGPDACWEWQGTITNRGYGHFSLGNKLITAHRLIFELVNGPIPAGMLACHRCDNPACVNPAHLFLGTPADNSADMAAKGRAAKGERNAYAKLTADDVRQIRQSIAAGESQLSVAARFGVSGHAIHCVVHGKTWRHVA